MARRTSLANYLRSPTSLAVRIVREARKDHTRLARLALRAEERGRRDAVNILVAYYEGRISYEEALERLKALAGA